MDSVFYGITVLLIIVITYNMYLLDQATGTWMNTTHEYLITFESFQMSVQTTVKASNASTKEIYPFMLFGSCSLTRADGTVSKLSYESSTDTVSFEESKGGAITNRIVTVRKDDL